MKNYVFYKYIFVVAAFCLFFNSIGLHHNLIEPKASKNIQETEISTNEEVKSSVLVSFIDSEERNLEFENKNDSEEGGGSDCLIAILEQQLIAFYINDFDRNLVENQVVKYNQNLPLYIQYENLRL
ncbi:MAG: hypothetical protein FGM14_01700 [Flavobacteriales bacterium]|nr:hypothetical protein [Flavobacteriales bacterium]